MSNRGQTTINCQLTYQVKESYHKNVIYHLLSQ